MVKYARGDRRGRKNYYRYKGKKYVELCYSSDGFNRRIYSGNLRFAVLPALSVDNRFGPDFGVYTLSIRCNLYVYRRGRAGLEFPKYVAHSQRQSVYVLPDLVDGSDAEESERIRVYVDSVAVAWVVWCRDVDLYIERNAGLRIPLDDFLGCLCARCIVVVWDLSCKKRTSEAGNCPQPDKRLYDCLRGGVDADFKFNFPHVLFRVEFIRRP